MPSWRARKAETQPACERLARLISLNAVVAFDSSVRSEQREAVAAARTAEELLRGDFVTIGWPSGIHGSVDDALALLWDEGLHGPARHLDEVHKATSSMGQDPHEHVSWIWPRWYFVFSKSFMTSIERIEMRLQGRVLESIATIAQSPTTVVGFTIQPLAEDKNGLWRYYVDGHRIIYASDLKAKQTVLISFEPTARGFPKA